MQHTLILPTAVLLVPLAALHAGEAPRRPARPLVGTIRWDAWAGGEVTVQVERTLGPKQYHARLPWFAEVLGEDQVRIQGGRQEVMDQEIAYAARAGLDYWAFLLYPEASSMSESLRLYRNSQARRRINFCVILHNNFKVNDAQWPAERDRAVALLREPGYQTVLGGRPLVFAFQTKEDRIAQFRQAAQAVGSDPYCVWMGWNPAADFRRAATLGFEAVSAYACGSDDATFAALCQRVETNYWQRASTAAGTLCAAGDHGLGQAPAQGAPRVVGAGSRLSPADGFSRHSHSGRDRHASRTGVGLHPGAAGLLPGQRGHHLRLERT